MNKVINLTHYDLDGIVCYILLKNIFDIDRYYTCGYGKLSNRLDQIKSNYANENIIVSDFSLTKDQYELLEKLDKNLIFIDHHDSSILELSDKKINGIININYSASALVFHYFKNRFKKLSKYKGLKDLVYYTNFYDTWKTDTKEFNIGYQLNEILNMVGWNRFVEIYYNGFYGIHNSVKSEIKNRISDRAKLIKSGSKYIFDDKDAILLIYNDAEKIINDTTLVYDFKYYFVVSTELNKVSIRLKENNIALLMQRLFKDDDNVYNFGGHKHAGSFILKNMDSKILEKYIDMIYKGLKNG